MTISEANRLKALADENVKMKELPAEQRLDLAAMRELFQKNAAAAVKRVAVAHPTSHFGLSEPQA